MSYFHAPQPSPSAGSPRVGLTAGRVLGNAVERNRIKRRMREAVRRHLHLLPLHTDVVLHPRRSVLEINFAELSREVERIFLKIAGSHL
jgi:ribonuclease P protein component